MPNVSIQIKNLPEIKRAFAAAPVQMGKGLNTAIQKSIFSIQADSMRNTTVLTGRLRASHFVSLMPLKGVLEPMANYAIFVHEGTQYMKGRPFLFDAVRSNEDKVQGFFTEETQKVLDAIAKETE